MKDPQQEQRDRRKKRLTQWMHELDERGELPGLLKAISVWNEETKGLGFLPVGNLPRRRMEILMQGAPDAEEIVKNKFEKGEYPEEGTVGRIRLHIADTVDRTSSDPDFGGKGKRVDAFIASSIDAIHPHLEVEIRPQITFGEKIKPSKPPLLIDGNSGRLL